MPRMRREPADLMHDGEGAYYGCQECGWESDEYEDYD